MNAKQRNRLFQIYEELVRYRSELEDLNEEEQEKYDNLPESLQESEKGEAISECAETISDCVDSLNDAIDALEGML